MILAVLARRSKRRSGVGKGWEASPLPPRGSGPLPPPARSEWDKEGVLGHACADSGLSEESDSHPSRGKKKMLELEFNNSRETREMLGKGGGSRRKIRIKCRERANRIYFLQAGVHAGLPAALKHQLWVLSTRRRKSKST